MTLKKKNSETKNSTLSVLVQNLSDETWNYQSYLQKIKSVQKWLLQTWPNLFDLKNPKPLKRRIEKDIFPYLSAPFTKTQLRVALQAYTNRNAYLKSVLTEGWRYDLLGNPVEEILDLEKIYTAQKQRDKTGKLKKGKIRL
jgi:sRNA-binding protein